MRCRHWFRPDGWCVVCGEYADEQPIDLWYDEPYNWGRVRPVCKYPDSGLIWSDDPDAEWHRIDARRQARARERTAGGHPSPAIEFFGEAANRVSGLTASSREGCPD
jgi:hypothetical protein